MFYNKKAYIDIQQEKMPLSLCHICCYVIICATNISYLSPFHEQIFMLMLKFCNVVIMFTMCLYQFINVFNVKRHKMSNKFCNLSGNCVIVSILRCFSSTNTDQITWYFIVIFWWAVQMKYYLLMCKPELKTSKYILCFRFIIWSKSCYFLNVFISPMLMLIVGITHNSWCC